MESFFALSQRNVLDWDLPPPPPPTRLRQAHRERVRTAPRTRRNRGLKFPPRESTEPGAVPSLRRVLSVYAAASRMTDLTAVAKRGALFSKVFLSVRTGRSRLRTGAGARSRQGTAPPQTG